MYKSKYGTAARYAANLMLVILGLIVLSACGDSSPTAGPTGATTAAGVVTIASTTATTLTTAAVTTVAPSAITTAVTTTASPSTAATTVTTIANGTTVATITAPVGTTTAAPVASVSAGPTTATGGTPGATTAVTSTTAAATFTTPPDNPAIKRDDLTIDLGDGLQTKAQLSYPSAGNGPFPTVVMIAGTGPWDLDASLSGLRGVYGQLFRPISDALNLQGFAVMRYNKRYVKGPGDTQAYQLYNTPGKQPTLQQLQADADKVYTTAKAQPKVDPTKIVLYGWSEGTTIAAQVAVAHPEIAGLVLHAAPSGSWHDLFTYQAKIAFDYMTSLDTDKDGALSLDEANQAFRKGVGIQLQLYLFSTLYDPSSATGTPKLSVANDKNGDGKLDLQTEVKPALDQVVAFQTQPNSIYSSQKALPPVVEALAKYTKPVLILQGVNDANVSPDDARKIDTTLTQGGDSDHKLIIYPGLGHTLGKSDTPATDHFAPIEPQPIQDTTAWLSSHFVAKK